MVLVVEESSFPIFATAFDTCDNDDRCQARGLFGSGDCKGSIGLREFGFPDLALTTSSIVSRRKAINQDYE